MNEVKATEINWLWYPYIPYGKITVIQGDPGDGITTAVLAIAAAATSGMAYENRHPLQEWRCDGGRGIRTPGPLRDHQFSRLAP